MNDSLFNLSTMCVSFLEISYSPQYQDHSTKPSSQHNPPPLPNCIKGEGTGMLTKFVKITWFQIIWHRVVDLKPARFIKRYCPSDVWKIELSLNK